MRQRVVGARPAVPLSDPGHDELPKPAQHMRPKEFACQRVKSGRPRREALLVPVKDDCGLSNTFNSRSWGVYQITDRHI